MLKYLYIPQEKDLDEFIEFAVENNFNQIIHGDSDILNDFSYDNSNIHEINIPEYRHIENENLVFKENEIFTIRLVDEFNIKENYKILGVNLFRVDDNNLNKKDFILYKDMDKIDDYIYDVDIQLEVYGEYIIDIIAQFDDKKETLLKDSIVIYKEWIEDNTLNDKFYFPE
jgi:hypothetical protein